LNVGGRGGEIDAEDSDKSGEEIEETRKRDSVSTRSQVEVNRGNAHEWPVVIAIGKKSSTYPVSGCAYN
jgi:hypothetical protein